MDKYICDVCDCMTQKKEISTTALLPGQYLKISLMTLSAPKN